MLHHLDLYQETPVPRQGSNYPSWYWTWRHTTWNLPGNSWLSQDSSYYLPGIFSGPSHHLESSREQLALPGFEPLPPWYSFKTVTPLGISPPAEGERSPSTSISVAWITRGHTTATDINPTLPSGISQNTATPPRRCVSIKTFTGNGSKTLFVAVTL